MKRTKHQLTIPPFYVKAVLQALVDLDIITNGIRTRAESLLLHNSNTFDTCTYARISSNPIKKEQKSLQLDPLITSSMFEAFWTVYPRKIDKGLAKDRWNKICKAEDLRPTWRKVITSLQEQKKSERWIKQPEYIPHPTSWLNKARWMDITRDMQPYEERVDTTPQIKVQDGIKYYYGKDNRYWTKTGRLYIE